MTFDFFVADAIFLTAIMPTVNFRYALYYTNHKTVPQIENVNQTVSTY